MFRRVILVLVVVLAAILLVVFTRSPKPDEHGRILIATDVNGAVWSKDSNALYYLKGSGERNLYRYDIRTGRKGRCRVPPHVGRFDVSPDEKQAIVSCPSPGLADDTETVSIVDLKTGKARFLGSAQYMSEGREVFWTATDTVVFRLDKDLVVADASGKVLRRVPDGPSPLYATCDGASVIHKDEKNEYHLYDTETGRDVSIQKLMGVFDRSLTYFVYASAEQIVCVGAIERKVEAVALNLKTMQIHRHLPGAEYTPLGISPDKTHAWILQIPRGEWGRKELYLTRDPLTSSAKERADH